MSHVVVFGAFFFSLYYALKKWKEKIHPLLLYLGF
jgi:hypothetical protein